MNKKDRESVMRVATSVMTEFCAYKGKPPANGAFPDGMEEQHNHSTRVVCQYILELLKRNKLIQDYDTIQGVVWPIQSTVKKGERGVGVCCNEVDPIADHEKKRLVMLAQMSSAQRYSGAIIDAAMDLYEEHFCWCSEKFGADVVNAWEEEMTIRERTTRERYLKMKKGNTT